MKKTGIVLILILITLIVVFSSMTYAFYSSARAELTFSVGSEVGSTIGLNLVNSNNALRPARATVDVDDYSKAQTNSNEQFAVYIVQYNASKPLNADFYIKSVVFKDKLGNDFSAGDQLYLNSILKFSIKKEADLETYNLNNLHLASSLTWKSKYDETNATTKANTSFSYSGITMGVGYLFLYIKFDVSDELLKPSYDDMTISFILSSSVAVIQNNE